MPGFESINLSSPLVDRYASEFVESIKIHCENAAEKAVQGIVKDLTNWTNVGRDISKYHITYGFANNEGSAAKRNLFANREFIRKESEKSWEENSLSFWEGFSYREYEKGCHEAVVNKVSELMQEAFNKEENKQLFESLNIENEFRGFFSNGKRQYSKIIPNALCWLVPFCGWIACCDDYESACESTYDGEVLIRVSGKNPEKLGERVKRAYLQ